MKKTLLILLFALQTISAEEPQVYPIAILGGGVGALTSAVYASRAGVTPLVIEGPLPGGAIMQSHSVQNWPGEIDITGTDLIDKLHKQAVYNGAHFLNEEVVAVDFSTRPFTITTQDLYGSGKTHQIKAQTVIIAMGSKPNYLGVPGEQNYWARGVHNCAVCDGSFYENKVVAVVGGADSAVTEAHYLARKAKKVLLIVRGGALRGSEEQRRKEILAEPNVEILYKTTVQEIKGNGQKVTEIIIKNEKTKKRRTLDVDGVFLAIGAKPNTQIFQNALELDALGYIVLKKDQQTSVDGVFAIGDIVDPIYKQAVSAAGDGAIAALQAEKFLAGEPKLLTTKAPSQSLTKSTKKSGVIEITSTEQFKQELKESAIPIFVDFYATWCGPCKAFAPTFQTWSTILSGKVKFLKVNVDKVKEVAKMYQVKGLPSMLIFGPGGTFQESKVGTVEIAQFLNSYETSQ
jgi:thioredoxin reductase (NADPH)